MPPTGLYTYPNVSALSGAPQFLDAHRDTLLDPTVFMEVLSPSTKTYDRGKKWRNYRTLDSLQEYLFIEKDMVHVEHYTRQPNNQWLLDEVSELSESLTLTSIDCTLGVMDIYEKVLLRRHSTRMTDRPRASSVVLRNDGREILMVRHRSADGSESEYWQLPGGGLEPGETHEAAALRELWEETGLQGRIVRHLFTIPYRLGPSTTFLVEVDSTSTATLGSDPEEATQAHRKLVGVAWVALDEHRDNPEVRKFLQVAAACAGLDMLI